MYPDSVHNWPDFLSPICFGLNTTPRTELANFTPAELFFGRKFQPIATLHLRNQEALSRNPNYTAYMEQLNLKLKVITDTVKVAEKLCQDTNKSRLDSRTPLPPSIKVKKFYTFNFRPRAHVPNFLLVLPKFMKLFQLIHYIKLRSYVIPMVQFYPREVHLSKLKPFFERDHTTDHANTSSASPVDTTAPATSRQINLPVQTTVVPNAGASRLSIQTSVTPSTTSMLTQPQLHTAPPTSQAPPVHPGTSSRAYQRQNPEVHSVQHPVISSGVCPTPVNLHIPRSLIPPLMHPTDSLRRSARISNRPYITKYSNFRPPRPLQPMN